MAEKEGGAFETDLALEDVFRAVERYELSASPVESADKTSPWLSLPARAHIGLSKVLGKSPYTARAGLVTWADGIYWARVVEKRPDGLLLVENLHDAGKREVECVKHPIEPEFLYPFVRWDHIRKWHARPSCYVILPHTLETGWRPVEPSLMKEVAPNTFAYLKRFEKILLKRSGYEQLREGQPFYICSNTGPWLFAPLKVAWRTMASPLNACVLSNLNDRNAGRKPPLFKNTVAFVPLDEESAAHFLCACLNSSCVELAARSYSVGKSMGSPHLLQQVAIPKFSPKSPLHRRLGGLSRDAHEQAARLAANPNDEDAKRELAKVEDQVDHAAAELWGLTDAELVEIRKALELLK